MHLRLSLLDPANFEAPGIDVAVSAPHRATFGQVRAALDGALGRPTVRWFVGSTAVADDDILGAAPLLHGAVLVADSPGTSPRRTGMLELSSVAGPEAGVVVRLPPGEHCVGRAAECGVRIGDPDLSRLHAVVTVESAGVTVRDLGSLNGTHVNGVTVDRIGVPLLPGSQLRLGTSVLALTSPDATPAATRPDGLGHVEVNRPPRPLSPAVPVTVTLPTEPRLREGPRLPVLAIVLPLMLGLVLAVLLTPLYAVFMVLSPVMMLGSHMSERQLGRKSNRKALADHEAALSAALGRRDVAVAEEVARRRTGSMDAAELSLTASGPRARLWERRRGDPDFLSVRLGTADLPSGVTVRAPAMSDAASAAITASSVPVTVNLRDVGVLGIAGGRQWLEGVGRHVVGHLAGLHSPRDLELVVLTADCAAAESWRWATWLPHLRPAAGQDCAALVGWDQAQVATRVAELMAALEARQIVRASSAYGAWTGRRSVVVLDGARALRGVPGMTRLLEEGPKVGLHLVCLDAERVALPVECAATAEATGDLGTGLRLEVHGSAPILEAVPDRVSAPWAERLGRALAPLEDATPDGEDIGLPDSARLVDVLADLTGHDITDEQALVRLWSSQPPSMRAVLGVGAEGPLSVDLTLDGPHALVAGTTGSGKSELLQTLVASLAVANRPDALSFVLVDYKGGSAFQDCARLPHTVGLVTDLDGPLTERALASLGAELRRRERVLRDSGAKDLEDYLQAAGQAGPDSQRGGPPMPRLVLIVDEFATLAEELPDFVGGLVGIAQRGRSLGVHLILATQRPGGVVSADIRANTTLRIALRVTDPGESLDVIDTKDAALIGRSTPGRAYARTGSGATAAFQSARVGGHAPAVADRPITVRPQPWRHLGDRAPRAPLPSHPPGHTDLARLVDAARGAAAAMALPAVASPWLPPLPTCVPLSGLSATGAWQVPVGLCDLPAEQRQATWSFDLEHGGHLLVAGGPRSGRSTVLRTLAAAIAEGFSVGDVHVHGIDGSGGSLPALASLPHCGAVVGHGQTARGDRLITRLAEEVGRRQQLLRAGGFSSVAEQRAAAPAAERLPWLVLLVDGWEGFVSTYDGIEHGRPVDALLRLLREGGGAGLRAIVTGDRSALIGRLSALTADRLLLRFADPADAALAGVPPRLIAANQPPGRGVLADGVVATQVALVGGDAAGPAQHAALDRLARRARTEARSVPPALWPLRVEPLPDCVRADDLIAGTAAAQASSSGHGDRLTQDEFRLWALLGVGGDELTPVGADLAADGAFVVVGPTGSGRSTALRTLAKSLVDRGTDVALVVPRRSPLRHLAGEDGMHGPFGVGDTDALAELLELPRPMVVLCDDAEAVADSPLEAMLMRLMRSQEPPTRGLVVAGGAAEMSSAYRGLTVEARRSRHGLLLAPGGGLDSDLLGTHVPRLDDARPGRGVLVARGRTTVVQVAC